MSKEDVKEYLDKHVTMDTYALLRNYLRWGIRSRAFMLVEHNKMFADLEGRVGRYSSYTDEQIAFVEGRLSIELLERLMLLIEDFAKITSGLSRDLKQFPQAVLADKDPKARLRKLDAAAWREILRYGDIGALGLSGEDGAFIESVRAKNIEWILALQSCLLQFVEVHWQMFLKHKHGNTIIYGFEAKTIDGQRAIVVSAIVDPSTPARAKGLVVTKGGRDSWWHLFEAVDALLRDVVERNVEFVERAGVGFAERCTYFVMTSEQRERLERIVAQVEHGRERVPIDLRMHLEVPREVVEKEKAIFQRFGTLKEIHL